MRDDSQAWTSLTGFWTGAYWYGAAANPTPFNAYFEDEAGSLSGTSLEPNTFAPGGLQELAATLSGVRTGERVDFTKVYDPAPGVHRQPIRYAGVVDGDFVLIEGIWRFDQPGHLSGAFRLERLRGAQQAAARELEAVNVIRNWVNERGG